MAKAQWFVAMEKLAEPAIEVLKATREGRDCEYGKLQFVPERFDKTYLGRVAFFVLIIIIAIGTYTCSTFPCAGAKRREGRLAIIAVAGANGNDSGVPTIKSLVRVTPRRRAVARVTHIPRNFIPSGGSTASKAARLGVMVIIVFTFVACRNQCHNTCIQHINHSGSFRGTKAGGVIG